MNLRAQSLLPPINADALLIWPRGGNSGDMLILQACERYLRDRGILAWVSDGSVEDAALTGDADYLGDLFATYRGMVMFPGGGNIGIYPDNGFIRSAIISRLRPRHRCLIFPQSASGPEEALTKPQVTVWCRDAVSREILDRSGARTALVPDAALYMDDRIEKPSRGSGVFYIRRARGGDAETVEHGIGGTLPSGDLTHRLPLAEIISALAPYETIVSDRLHGGLISLMLGKKVVLLPVGYHKIKSFYETWLRPLTNIAYAESQSELEDCLVKLRTQSYDFSALFCSCADPALDRFLIDA